MLLGKAAYLGGLQMQSTSWSQMFMGTGPSCRLPSLGRTDVKWCLQLLVLLPGTTRHPQRIQYTCVAIFVEWDYPKGTRTSGAGRDWVCTTVCGNQTEACSVVLCCVSLLMLCITVDE